MRVLLTRPQEDSRELAMRLSERGHESIIAPLLSIRFLDGPEVSLSGVQAVLATSANGIHAFARRTRRRDIALFAVGPKTAQAARMAGFSDVHNAHGDAGTLAEAVREALDPAKGALVHATAAQMREVLASSLRATGFEVRTAALYETIAVDSLPPEAAKALFAGTLEAALFFSPRTAAIFRDCTIKAGIAERCEGVVAASISTATAAALAPLKFRELRVASAPNQERLLALLG